MEVGSEDTLRLLATDWGADLTAASSGRVCPGAYKPLSAYTVDSEPTTPLMAAAAYGSQRMYGVLLEMGEHFRGKFSMDISRGGGKKFCRRSREPNFTHCEPCLVSPLLLRPRLRRLLREPPPAELQAGVCLGSGEEGIVEASCPGDLRVLAGMRGCGGSRLSDGRAWQDFWSCSCVPFCVLF